MDVAIESTESTVARFDASAWSCSRVACAVPLAPCKE